MTDRRRLLGQLTRLNRLLARFDAEALYPMELAEAMSTTQLEDAVHTTEDHYAHIAKLLVEQEGR